MVQFVCICDCVLCLSGNSACFELLAATYTTIKITFGEDLTLNTFGIYVAHHANITTVDWKIFAVKNISPAALNV